MARYPVGPSSYGDLKGQMQYVNSPRIAAQFLSMKIDFDRLPSSLATGARLSVNEGMRSRVRQMYLWLHRFILAIVVAVPYTSRHDEVLRGNAMDIGVTMPDGSNRALTPAEFAWMHDQCQRRGMTWTGIGFNEPWHIEGATRPEILSPYPAGRANVEYAFGPIPTAKPDPKPAPAPKPAPYLPKEIDMWFARSKESDSPYMGDATSVRKVSETEARAWSAVIPHEKDKPLFTVLPSATVTTIIKGVRANRDAANLIVTKEILDALAAEAKAEGK